MADDFIGKVREMVEGGPTEPQPAFNTWIRVDSGQRPDAYIDVILHTPQFMDTHGPTATGLWDGQRWVADDERDLDLIPPVHYMVLALPEYQGSTEEWANVDIADEPIED